MTRKRLAFALSAALLAASGYIGLGSLIAGARADDLQSTIDTRRARMKDIGAQMKAIYAVVDAKSGDMAAFAAQFAATGKACGTCHTDFRAKLN